MLKKTLAIITEAIDALGMYLKGPVAKKRMKSSIEELKSEDTRVATLHWALIAVLEILAAAGMQLQTEDARLTSPKARNSWETSILYPFSRPYVLPTAMENKIARIGNVNKPL